MKFSTRATYGLKALLFLADQYGQRTVPVSRIAQDGGISAQYLEQILHVLKKKRWIRSRRGPQGGYRLAKNPSEVRIGPVLRDLEGAQFGFTQEADAKAPSNTAGLASQLFWKRLAEGFSQVLDSTSLKDLIEHARQSEKKRKTASRLTFNI